MSNLTRKIDKLRLMLTNAEETLASARSLNLTEEQITTLEESIRLIQEDIDYLMSSI